MTASEVGLGARARRGPGPPALLGKWVNNVSDGRLARVTLLDGLVEVLSGQIQSGELPPGTQLPGEAAVGERWGVSRLVVREALALLRDRAAKVA